MPTDVSQVETKSPAGSQYFVTFIDGHTRKLWVSPLKTKDQVLSVFKEFHAMNGKGNWLEAEGGLSGQRR